MNCSVKKIELVSPAGGWDQLIAAINAGADAVYIGYSKFSARAYAENFDLPALKKAVKTAHEYNVKVYLALNILLKDEELKEISFFLNEYLSFCQDGIIIQDFGLYKAIRDIFGKTRIHASTQMNIHNSSSCNYLYDEGFARVVLAREMTLKEISSIYNSYNKVNGCPEIEIFGHGSQCYCYSGSCYFSSFTGLRSGNRGRCTQPCRMKYDLGQQNGRLIIEDSYILSKKDLSVISMIPQIAETKVDAIKIEGRAKSAEYVGIITSIYRKYLDMYYSDPLNYSVSDNDMFKVFQIFSREMTEGYLKEEFPEDIISMKKSGSVGNFLGRVQKTGRKYIILKSGLEITKGDILEVWTNKGNSQLKVIDCRLIQQQEASTGKKSAPGKRKGQNKDKALKKVFKIESDKEFFCAIGDRVFKFFDKNLDRQAKNFYKNGLIRKKEKSTSEITPEEYSIPFKKISKCRIEEYFKNENATIKEVNSPCISLEVYGIEEALTLIKSNALKMVKNVIVNNFNEIFTENDREIKKIMLLNDLLAEKNINTVIKTPGIIYDDRFKLFEYGFNNIFENGINNFSISNCGIFKYISGFCSRNVKSNNGIFKKNNNLNIYLDHSLNIFNINAVKFYISFLKNNPALRIKNITLSSELCLDEAGKIINHDYFETENKMGQKPASNSYEKIDFNVYSYGYFPVMRARYKIEYMDKTPGKTAINKPGSNKKEFYLIDRKGYRFRILS
ncbi:MAG: U32 family peptidase, partial [Actinobacteria bacterium]|nr:U32 family peptidase [Actinomycetota bacterium]